MTRFVLWAALAAVFVVTWSGDAQARRYAGMPDLGHVVTQYCGDRVCGFVDGRRGNVRTTSRHRRQPRQHDVAVVSKPADPFTVIGKVFAGGLRGACALPGYLADGTRNALKAFHDRLAQIVEPVRPGFVAIMTASGRRAVVAERAAERFVGFIRDLEATGYPIRDIGGYAYRNIAGTRHLSKHAFGLAVDINQEERNVVSVHMDRGLVSRLATKNGLCSGGDWRHGDLGHFETCSGPIRVAKAAHRQRVRYAVAR